MSSTPVRRIGWIMCLLLVAGSLWSQPSHADTTAQNPLVPQYNKVIALIEGQKFDEAKAQALILVKAAQPNDAEQAGTIRAVVDSFRSHSQPAAASEVLAAAQDQLKPSGQIAVILAGDKADKATISKLRVIYRPMKTRAIFNPSVDLKRIRIGHQASILKIMDPTNTKEVFMKGLDGVLWAPINDDHRTQIFAALGIGANSLDAVTTSLIDGYGALREKEQAIALLGALGSSKGSQVSDAVRMKLLAFLVARMNNEKDHALRRQAVLALALQDAVTDSTVNAVVNFYATNTNVWETFPVQQFFEYQSARLHKMSNLAQIRAKVQAVNCFYTENILKFL